MAFVNITTATGELLDRIDTADYDLSRPIARQALSAEILEALETAHAVEATPEPALEVDR